MEHDGIDVNASSGYTKVLFVKIQMTPLMIAAEKGNLEIAELLLKNKNIDIDIKCRLDLI